MKRRTFLSASAVSLVGVLNASAMPLSFLPVQHQWLSTYLEVIGATSMNRLLTTDQELDRILQEKSEALRKTGYKTFGSDLHYSSQDRIVMHPLALLSQKGDILDIALLFFQKDTTTAGSWKYTGTFTSFELEAICQVIDQLPVRPDEQELTALFVPVFELPHQRKPYSFKTASGHIALKVKVEESKNTMDFKLVKGDSILVATSFTSRSSLCCSPLA